MDRLHLGTDRPSIAVCSTIVFPDLARGCWDPHLVDNRVS